MGTVAQEAITSSSQSLALPSSVILGNKQHIGKDEPYQYCEAAQHCIHFSKCYQKRDKIALSRRCREFKRIIVVGTVSQASVILV